MKPLRTTDHPEFFLRLTRAALRVGSLCLKVTGVLCAGLMVGILVLRQPWPSLVRFQPYLAKVPAEDLRLERRVDQRVLARSLSFSLLSGKLPPTGLWHLRAVRAQEAWALLEARQAAEGGRSRVLVGVNEIFIDPGHPDLAENTLPGLLDDGWVQGLSWLLNLGHGTGVMGIIAGRGGPGMTGVAPRASLLPFSRLASGQDSSVAASLRFFRTAGARIANFSMAAPWEVADQATVDEAYQHGLLLVAGLYNRDTQDPAYPAAYHRVLAVSGIGPEDNALGYGWGTVLDVVAPGSGVLTSASALRVGPVVFGQLYRPLCCNSLATAVAAGVAALLLEHDPSLSSPQVEKRIKLSARKTGEMRDQRGHPVRWHPRYGYGVLDAYAALTYDRQGPEVTLDPMEREADGSLRLTGQARDDVEDSGLEPARSRDRHLVGIPTSNVERVEYQMDEGPWNLVQLSRPLDFPTALSDFTRRFTILLDGDLAQGRHTLRVRAWDSAGNRGAAAVRELLVPEGN